MATDLLDLQHLIQSFVQKKQKYHDLVEDCSTEQTKIQIISKNLDNNLNPKNHHRAHKYKVFKTMVNKMALRNEEDIEQMKHQNNALIGRCIALRKDAYALRGEIQDLRKNQSSLLK